MVNKQITTQEQERADLIVQWFRFFYLLVMIFFAFVFNTVIDEHFERLHVFAIVVSLYMFLESIIEGYLHRLRWYKVLAQAVIAVLIWLASLWYEQR